MVQQKHENDERQIFKQHKESFKTQENTLTWFKQSLKYDWEYT